MRKLAALLMLALFVPAFVSAQNTSADLQATIRAALASDPRTNAMSPEALDALAAQLADGAARQGMTPQDITWRPIESAPASEATQPSCSIFPQYFCTISESFGFMGGDPTIAIWLGAAALMLIFIVGEMRYLRRRHLRSASAAPIPPAPPVTAMPPAPPQNLQS